MGYTEALQPPSSSSASPLIACNSLDLGMEDSQLPTSPTALPDSTPILKSSRSATSLPSSHALYPSALSPDSRLPPASQPGRSSSYTPASSVPLMLASFPPVLISSPVNIIRPAHCSSPLNVRSKHSASSPTYVDSSRNENSQIIVNSSEDAVNDSSLQESSKPAAADVFVIHTPSSTSNSSINGDASPRSSVTLPPRHPQPSLTFSPRQAKALGPLPSPSSSPSPTSPSLCIPASTSFSNLSSSSTAQYPTSPTTSSALPSVSLSTSSASCSFSAAPSPTSPASSNQLQPQPASSSIPSQTHVINSINSVDSPSSRKSPSDCSASNLSILSAAKMPVSSSVVKASVHPPSPQHALPPPARKTSSSAMAPMPTSATASAAAPFSPFAPTKPNSSSTIWPSLPDQQALFTVLTSTPILMPQALVQITEQTITLLMMSASTLHNSLVHIYALNQVQRRFASMIELVQAIEMAKVDGSYLSLFERQKIIDYLSAESCMLFSAPTPQTVVHSFPVQSTLLTAAEANVPVIEAVPAFTAPDKASDEAAIAADNARKQLQQQQQQKQKHERALMLMAAAGLTLDAAYVACACRLDIFLGFCERYAAMKVVFVDFASLCHYIIAQIRPSSTPLSKATFEQVMALLYSPSMRSLLLDPSRLRSLTPSSLDLNYLVFEGAGVDGVRASLLRFLSIERSFQRLDELWPAVHISWRYGYYTTYEMRQHLHTFLMRECAGLLIAPASSAVAPQQAMALMAAAQGRKLDDPSSAAASAPLAYPYTQEELEYLIVSGRGLMRTQLHCQRLMRASFRCTSIHALVHAFYATLTLLPSEHQQLSAYLSADCALFSSLDANTRLQLVSSFTPNHFALLLHEAGGSVSTLLSHLDGFQRLNRRFVSFIDLVSSLQLATLSASYSSPAAVHELIAFFMSSPTMFASNVDLYLITGEQYDLLIGKRSIPTLLLHLARLSTLQRAFTSLAELQSNLEIAFQYGIHTDDEMRQSLRTYLLSKECVLFDQSYGSQRNGGREEHHALLSSSSFHSSAFAASSKELKAQWQEEDRLLDLMITVSGSLTACLHHLTRFQALAMRFQQLAQLAPAIKHVVSTGAYASRAMSTALLRYLAAPECKLLSAASFSSLSTVSVKEIDELLITGGGLLNTLKHLSRLNACAQRYSKLSALEAAVRSARKTRLYYSEQERSALFAYLSSKQCRLFSEIQASFEITDRDMERLFRYGHSVEETHAILRDLNASNKRFRSFTHLLIILKKVSAFRHSVSFGRKLSRSSPGGSDHTPRSPIADKLLASAKSTAIITPQQRQEIISHLSSASSMLFSDHSEPLRVTSAEIDALILSTGDSSSALKALRALNQMGRRFPSMDDLLLAVSSMIGPQGLITLSNEQRGQLLHSLSFPSCRLFVHSQESIRVNEQDLLSLVFVAGGTVDALLAHVQRYEQVARQFYNFAELRSSLEQSVKTGLYSRVDERALLLALMTGKGYKLLHDRDRNRTRLMATLSQQRLEEFIACAQGFASCVYHLQWQDENLHRFDSIDQLLDAIRARQKQHPTPGEFSRLTSSTSTTRYQLFAVLSMPSSQLFVDASEDDELEITPLACDLFFTRVGNIDRAIAIIAGLERLERRFMSFAELIWDVCKVSDEGANLKEIEESADEAYIINSRSTKDMDRSEKYDESLMDVIENEHEADDIEPDSPESES